VVFVADVFDIDRRLGIFHIQRFQVIHDDTGDSQVAEPLVIRWNDEPRRMIGTATGKRLLIRRNIIAPEAAYLLIPLTDLPARSAGVEAILEAFQLLRFRDVQIELENVGVVCSKRLFEVIDLIVAA